MEQDVCVECVATFRNKANSKKRVIYKACPMKAAYKEGLVAFEKEFGQSAEDAEFELAEISIRDIAEEPMHQWSWYEEFDIDLFKEGRVDGYALNAYTMEQLKNPDLID
ncbi:MAG: hypothetical protein P4L87_26155 [Formivibrio sp.]|nr:hypothetical protein [Formivibrio sp.]